MQAIRTKYHGPTDHRSSRVTATAEAGKVTLTWDSDFDVEANHRRAALALCRKFGWLDASYYGPLFTGGLKDSYVHVSAPKYQGSGFKFTPEQIDMDNRLIASLPSK